MVQPKKFEVIEENETASQTENTGFNLLLLGLQALSQRAVAGIKDLFTLLSVASAFWLWFSIPNPNIQQIVSLSIYASFVLVANLIVRKIRAS